MSLQRRRMALCDAMAARLKAGALSARPRDALQLLADAQPFGADVDNERRVLQVRKAPSWRRWANFSLL